MAGPLLLGGGPAHAQLMAAPESLYVALRAGGEATAAVTLTSGGGTALRYCLDFDRPLQQRADDLPGASTCFAPGGRLALLDRSAGLGWDPLGLAMTPDGRLFAADYAPFGYTWELTADLQLVRYFDHPFVAQLSPFAVTVGVTYNEDTGTLWWTNMEESEERIERVLLLEGDLDGVPTGRRIELPVPPGPLLGGTGYPKGAAYDPALKRYYYVDGVREELWAVDTAGVVQPGYPVVLARYPSAYLGHAVDVHGGAGGDAQGVRLEVAAGFEFDLLYDRIVVTDPEGADLAAETPIPALGGQTWGAEGTSLRSRLDPNGVMYVPYATFDSSGVAAIRPVPLAPTWLALDAWNGTIDAGGQADVVLTFRAGARAPGVYRTTLAVEDTTGVVLAQVPLVLEVLPGTAGEQGPAPSGLALSVAPNPIRDGRAEVALALPEGGPATVAVYDGLGRRVAVLHEGPLAAGAHRLAWETAGLRPGVYVVRLWADGATAARRVVVP